MIPRLLFPVVLPLLIVPALAVPADTMRIHILNVGGGDAIFMRCPEGKHELLVDSGDSSNPEAVERFRAFLTSIQPEDNMIERVIATHQHPNHLGNMPWVLRNFRVGLYTDNGYEPDSPIVRNIAAILAEKRTSRANTLISVRPPDVDFCPLRDVTIRIIKPYIIERLPTKTHFRTIALRLDYRDTAFLFLGNVDAREGEMLMQDPATAPLLKSFFLKTDDGNAFATPELLDMIDPHIVVVSGGGDEPGKGNRLRRPEYAVLQTLLRHAWPREGPVTQCTAWDGQTRGWKTVVLRQAVYITKMDKHLVFETDGKTIHKVATTAR